MIRLSRAQLEPIGLDIGRDSVKMLQVQVFGANAVVRATSREDVSDAPTDDAVARVAGMLRRGGFRGRRVVTALPREIVQVKNVRLPVMPPAQLQAAVEVEAKGAFGFDSTSGQIRFLPAGEVQQASETRQEGIIVGARGSDIESFLNQFQKHGLVVESLDFEPCAVFRSVERFAGNEESDEVQVLVDIGRRRTQVVIGRGRQINFFRAVEIGGQEMNDAVARKLGISVEEARALRRRLFETSPADAGERTAVRQAVIDATRNLLEALAREISLCLRYYAVTFRGSRPQRLLLTGGESINSYAQASLARNLPLPVQRARVSEWATALGLGLRKTTRRLNLLEAPRVPEVAHV